MRQENCLQQTIALTYLLTYLLRIVSNLSQISVFNLDTALLNPLWGLRDTCIVHLRLIGKLVVDFIFALIELFRYVLRLRANVDQESAFLKGVIQYWPNFHVVELQRTSSANHFCVDRQASECLTTLLLHDSIHTKKLCSRHSPSKVQFKTENGRFAFLSPLWELVATYNVQLRLIGKHVVDFLLVLIELFSLGVTAEALRANID